jgi:putative RNA 2'-phosphotransferase
VLRHRPELIGIRLDASGWARFDQVLAGCKRRGVDIDEVELRRLVSTNAKQRYALSDDGTRIRASQGHSVTVDLQYTPAMPPDILFHGTGVRSVPSILSKGLVRGKRHHVHLSPDIQTAAVVGRRHGELAVFEIDARRMHERGIEFFATPNHVWLTEHVAARFLRLIDLSERKR